VVSAPAKEDHDIGLRPGGLAEYPKERGLTASTLEPRNNAERGADFCLFHHFLLELVLLATAIGLAAPIMTATR